MNRGIIRKKNSKTGWTAYEADEQKTLFIWASYMTGRYPELRLMYAIPNGGSRHPAEAAHLKAQGVKAGVPDICLPCARSGYHGLYIEMKRTKGGRLSEEQKIMIEALRDQGYKAEVCKGWENARKTIEKYLTCVK